MRICFDMDGVLADFTGGWVKLMNETYNLNHPPGPPDNWDLQASYGLTDQQHNALWEAVQHTAFWERLDPDPSCTNETFLKIGMLAMMNDVYFMTVRVGERSKLYTERWLYHKGIKFPTVIKTIRKGEIADILGLDAIIDDYHLNLLDIANNNGERKIRMYLRDRPYNKLYQPVLQDRGVVVVEDVNEFLQREGL